MSLTIFAELLAVLICIRSVGDIFHTVVDMPGGLGIIRQSHRDCWEFLPKLHCFPSGRVVKKEYGPVAQFGRATTPRSWTFPSELFGVSTETPPLTNLDMEKVNMAL